MKKVIVLVVFILLHTTHCSAKVIVNDKNLVSNAINGILERYFEPRESKVDLIYHGVKGGLSEKIVEAILRSKSSGVSVKVIRVPPENNQWIHINISSIHIFDSKEIYKQAKKYIRCLSDPNRRYEQLIHVPGVTTNHNMEFIMSHHNIYVNINFLIVEKDFENSVKLIGFFKNYSPPICNVSQPTIINRFVQSRWENSSFFPKHFLDFNGCPLTVLAYHNFSMLHLIINTLAQHMRFQLRLMENSNTSVDTTMGYHEIGLETSSDFSYSVVIENDKAVLVVPPGEPYSQFEKMFLMFQSEVWIAIAATFVVTLVIIQAINLMSIKVRNFVYGHNIRSPTLNLIDIFLNGGQNQEPKRNFSRFILMLFVVWSLVIRTCYQSELYKLLQTDLRKPRLETIDQLIENNFTLYYDPNRSEVFLGQELLAKFKSSMEVNSTTLLPGSNIKYAFVHSKNYLSNFAKDKHHRHTEIPFHPIVEELRSIYISVLMPKFLPFYERFNELIERMVTHGLTIHWNDEMYGKDPPKNPDEPEPQVMSLDHIGIGFYIILGLLCLSIVVFALEIIYHKFAEPIKSRLLRMKNF